MAHISTVGISFQPPLTGRNPQEVLARHADRFFHPLNGLPLDINKRQLGNRVIAPLGLLKDTQTGLEFSSNGLCDRHHLLNDFGLVTEPGEDLLEPAVRLSEFSSVDFALGLSKRLAPLLVSRGRSLIQSPYC